jgi:hypothetical protein
MVEETPYSEIIEETCPSCRHTVTQGTAVCPNCGFQIREEPKPALTPKAAPPKAERVQQFTEKAAFGGWLILISGILAVITGIYMVIDPETFVELYTGIGYTFSTDVMVGAGVMALIFGIVAIAGGLAALKKRSWGLAVIGGFLGFIASGAFFLGTLLGLIGLILVAVSKREFKS